MREVRGEGGRNGGKAVTRDREKQLDGGEGGKTEEEEEE